MLGRDSPHGQFVPAMLTLLLNSDSYHELFTDQTVTSSITPIYQAPEILRAARMLSQLLKTRPKRERVVCNLLRSHAQMMTGEKAALLK